MLISALIFLLAAVISVPIAQKLRLGSVMGYLIAGVLIGPYLLGLVRDPEEIMHFAEFGVIMMLFLIGLELKPSRLWSLRKSILGVGGAQVIVSSLLIFLVLSYALNTQWQTALAAGLALALSSTAIVLQSFEERGLLPTQTGQNVFSVLLFQDIAVIPILALLPLLSSQPEIAEDVAHSSAWMSGLPAYGQVLVSVITIVSIVAGGRFVSAPVFRFVAESRLREIFTALSLLIVIAITVLMEAIGLSPALGAFLAGVVLADSQFRHELVVDIAPFKGLLLGLFFITVGAGINFQLLFDNPTQILCLLLGLMAIKAVVLLGIARVFGFAVNQSTLFAAALCQGGEFAFVLVNMSGQLGIFTGEFGNTLTLVVTLSMLMTPLLFILHERWFARQPKNKTDDADTIDFHGEIIIAGYGRFGQIVGRLLNAQGYRLTILDHSPSQIELLRKFGHKVYYGDASRRDLLDSAGAATAKLLVVAVDDPVKSLQIIAIAQQHFPNLKILARAIDRRHTYELMRLNIAGLRRETFDSAIHLGVQALVQLGVSQRHALRAGSVFTTHDEETMEILAQVWGDEKSYGVAVRQRMDDLRQVLEADQRENQGESPLPHAETEKT